MKRCDVIIIGGGIAGLSAAHHLAAMGSFTLVLSHGAPEGASSKHAAGLVAGGQVDNFTRITHAHGEAVGDSLWRFGDAAFDSLAAFCAKASVPLRQGRRRRLITSPAELVEAEKAVALMQARGLVASLGKSTAGLTDRVLAVQDDGARAGCIDVPLLMSALERASAGVPHVSSVKSLELTAGGVIATCVDGEVVHAEIAVIAAHLGTGELVPELKDALVPYADQWTELKLGRGALEWTGTAFSANHTYEWGVFSAPDVLRIGGGRYFRPMAGIDATRAEVVPKIIDHLVDQVEKTFTFAGGAKVGLTASSREIRPCDELPVIGPMYGRGRALIATGFMGAGLTMGFLAGQCLAELIKHGRCDKLPRELWPERLRTLES